MKCKCLEAFWESTPDGLLVDPNMDRFCDDGNCIKDGSDEENV